MRLTFFAVCVLSACAAGSAEGPGAHSATAAAGGSTSTASGCAPAATGQPGDCAFHEEPPPTRTICKEEKVTGTNITRTVCRSEEDAQIEREAAKSWMQRNGADPTSNGQPINPGHDPFQRIPR